MSAAPPSLDVPTWLDSLVQSAEEVATGPLGFAAMQVVAKGPTTPPGVQGSYIALVGDDQSVQIGVVATPDDSAKLARALLGMAPEDEVSSGDVSDAIGEIANIIGGGVKRRISEHCPGFKLGLPLFIQGRLVPSDQQEVASAEVRMGAVGAHLIVIRHRTD